MLALIGEGATNAEVGARLHISEKTVDHHVSAILQKLDVRSRTEAAHVSRRLGIEGSAADSVAADSENVPKGLHHRV